MKDAFPTLAGGVSAAFAVAALIFSAATANAQAVSVNTLRSVAAIVAQRGAERVTVGSAFFVEVPSKTFPGSSFVYLVTARHVLFDQEGRPIEKLWVVLEDLKNGASREDSLPDESHWLLDLKHESADIAALPLSPQHANIAPIPLSSLFAEAAETRVGVIPASVDVGAQCYFLTATALGGRNRRFVPLARFCRVSLADAVQAPLPGAEDQALYFVDAAGSTELSGAPVFARAGERYVLFGMMEPEASTDSDSALGGLAGVLPAGYIAETVEAMAVAQERRIKAKH